MNLRTNEMTVAFGEIDRLWEMSGLATHGLAGGTILHHASPPDLHLRDGRTLWTGLNDSLAGCYVNFDMAITGTPRTMYRISVLRTLTLAVLPSEVMGGFCRDYCRAAHWIMSTVLSKWGEVRGLDGMIHIENGEVLIFQPESQLLVCA